MMKCFASATDLTSCVHTLSFSAIITLLSLIVALVFLTLTALLGFFKSRTQHKKIMQKFQALEHNQNQVLQEHSTLTSQLKTNQVTEDEDHNLLNTDNQTKSRFHTMRAAYSDKSTSFWARKTKMGVPDGYWPAMKSSLPIMMIANNQNGSGKTTIAAYLAASYAAQGQRVLVVDLDFQGKLSQMMRAQSGIKASDQHSQPSTVERILESSVFDNWPKIAILDAQKNLDYISAAHSLEDFERVMEYSWLLEDEPDDMRYRLARILLSSPVQNQYDRVILDSSAGISASFINGFCAATHLFIPCKDTKYALQGLMQTTRTYSLLKPLNEALILGGVIPLQTNAASQNEKPLAPHILENSLHLTGQTVIVPNKDLSDFPEKGLAGLRQKTVQKSFTHCANDLAKIAPLKA